MTKAPIVCFVFNRPDHTRRTLEALARCDGASGSTLYIYSDGPRKDGTDAEIDNVGRVRELIRGFHWKGDLVIRESPVNKGLQASITDGISSVVEAHGRVIVTEDDILCGRHFLSYCNAALERYENDEEVMHINAFMFPHRKKCPDFFFSQYAMVWGWATWKRAWNHFSSDASRHLQLLKDHGKEEAFDLYGAARTLEMLRHQADGRLRTWDVLWYASIFNAKGLCLTPSRSLTRNTGLDGSGAHFTTPISRKQYRDIDREPDYTALPRTPSRIPESELPVIEAILDWNKPRLQDRISTKLSLMWKELLRAGEKRK